jgi:phage terminase small subunit
MILKNIRHETFCQEYMVHGNATAAYIKAGFTSRNGAAESGASLLLKNPNVAARIQELRAVKSEELGRLSSRVLRELEKIAFSRLVDALEYIEPSVDLEGNEVPGFYRMLPLARIPDDMKAAIVEIRVTRHGGQFIKLHDKIGALNVIAKILGMTSDLNTAIATLRKYGINLIGENGQWRLLDNQLSTPTLESGELASSNETED